MNERTKAEIVEHAKLEFPRESCGLILNVEGKEKYFPCKNIAENQSDFVLDPVDYMRAEELGQVLSVVHSHCNISPKPSQADRVGCEASGLPWHIVSYPNVQFETIVPSGYKAPLYGRQWSHGVLDCYSFVRDWYNYQLGIVLPDFEREPEWWKKGKNLYMDNFKSAGFEIVDGLQVGDGILMQVGTRVVNHAGIYLGNDLFAHHAIGRLSCREVYGGYWRKITKAVVRYKGKV